MSEAAVIARLNKERTLPLPRTLALALALALALTLTLTRSSRQWTRGGELEVTTRGHTRDTRAAQGEQRSSTTS